MPNALRIARARMKALAGPDTTETGEPDYASMFNRWMREKVLRMHAVKPDTLGTRPTSKGLLAGGDKE